MKFEDIRGFNLKDNYFAVCTYLTKDLIEEFDCLSMLDRVIKLYKTESIDLITLEPYYKNFGNLHSDISEETINRCSVEEIWGLCTIIDTKALINASRNVCGDKVDDLVINTTAFAIKELIEYKPVSYFLNMELAMTIYKHTHGQIAQFPYNYMKSYIEDFTCNAHSIKAFVNAILMEV